MGWEVKIDMSGQSKDCLWVCNVKMKKFLPGKKQEVHKKNKLTMRFIHIDVNFDVTYDGDQKPLKCA